MERTDKACTSASATLVSVSVTALAKLKPLPMSSLACATLTELALTVVIPEATKALTSEPVSFDQSDALSAKAGEPPLCALKVIAPAASLLSVSKFARLSFSESKTVIVILGWVSGTRIWLAAVLKAKLKLL